MKTKSAFTLIEMITVVAVIGILAALLLPALVRGREKARAIQCLANIKQLGVAYLAYTSDSRENLPWADGPENSWCPAYGMWWDEIDTWRKSPLLPYVGISPRTWQCPSYTWGDFGPTAMNYAANYYTGGAKWNPDDSFYDPPFPVITWHKLDSRLQTSKIFMLTDWRSGYCPGGAFMADPRCWDQPSQFRLWSLPGAQHSHGASFIFWDSHAEIKHWKDSRTWPIPFYDDGSATYQPNNPDIAYMQSISSRLK